MYPVHCYFRGKAGANFRAKRLFTLPPRLAQPLRPGTPLKKQFRCFPQRRATGAHRERGPSAGGQRSGRGLRKRDEELVQRPPSCFRCQKWLCSAPTKPKDLVAALGTADRATLPSRRRNWVATDTAEESSPLRPSWKFEMSPPRVQPGEVYVPSVAL